MLQLRRYIETLATSLVHDEEPDARADGRHLRAIMITDSEWEAVEELADMLKPFHDVTTYLSGSSYPTMSAVYPAVLKLRSSMYLPGDDENDEDDILTTEGDAFDGALGYEDAPEEEEEVGRPKKRKTKVNRPADTTNLVERVNITMSKLFAVYFEVILSMSLR
jgi:hypothetical protein